MCLPQYRRYALVLQVGRRRAEAYDSEDDWPEDEGELRWPPLTPAPVRLARDLVSHTAAL